MTTEEQDQPKGSGRRKLQGVLDELVQQTKEADEGLSADDAAVEEAAKSLVELPNSIKSEDIKRKGYGWPKKRRRRRKKEIVPTSDESDIDIRDGSGRHIPHVMTLFDRRVDLARFTDSTPLYVMCRDWMRNKPQKRRSRSSSAERVVVDVHVCEQESHSFPSPVPMPEGQRSDIPAALSPHNTNENLDLYLERQCASVNGEEEGEGEGEALKLQHLQRWRRIRSRWKEASLCDQERYSDSLKVLREMFQK